jgi:hypothetical protein
MEQLQPSFPDPALIGQFRTFGPFGPAYRVLEPVTRNDRGEWLIRIHVVETGEETDYPYAQAVNDPEAH